MGMEMEIVTYVVEWLNLRETFEFGLDWGLFDFWEFLPTE